MRVIVAVVNYLKIKMSLEIFKTEFNFIIILKN